MILNIFILHTRYFHMILFLSESWTGEKPALFSQVKVKLYQDEILSTAFLTIAITINLLTNRCCTKTAYCCGKS